MHAAMHAAAQNTWRQAAVPNEQVLQSRMPYRTAVFLAGALTAGVCLSSLAAKPVGRKLSCSERDVELVLEHTLSS